MKLTQQKIPVEHEELLWVIANPFFRRLMDTLNVGLSIVVPDGTILYFSKSTYALYGLDESIDVTGRNICEVFPSTAHHGVLETLRTNIINKSSSIALTGNKALCIRHPITDENGAMLCCITEVISGTAASTNMDSLIKDLHLLQHREKNYSENTASIPAYTFTSMIGNSKGIRDLKSLGARFAQTPNPVLILGESGTGKELVAQALHNASPRAGNAFLSVNCAALPMELAEAELFGYAEGAFTGSRKGGGKGKFELAAHGTIFLDEIGDLPLSLQAKLLRVIESKEIQKIGSDIPLCADFRLIAATNRNLAEMVQQGRFRDDLYHRLSALELVIPPLRHRREDIPLLVEHLLHEMEAIFHGRKISVSPAVLQTFAHYPWHGNVRELKNTLTYARCRMEDSERILGIHHLPAKFLTGLHQEYPPEVLQNVEGTLEEARNTAEHHSVLAALRHCGGNKSKAALALGISRNKLYNILKKMHIS